MINFLNTLSRTKTKFFHKKFIRNAFALYVGRSINLMVGLISTLIYGIIFQKKEIAVISLYEMVLFLFLEFGFSWSKITLTRFGKEELDKYKTLNHTSSIRIGIIFPLFFIAAFLILFFSKYLLIYINSNEQIIIIFLLLHLLLLIIHEHIIYILVTLEKHIQNVFYYIGLSIGKLCILGFLYLKFSEEVSAEIFIKLNVVLLTFLLLLRVIFFDVRNIFPFVFGNKNDYIRYLKFAAPMIYGISGLYIINWVDVYYIRKYCSFDDLGSYQFLYSIFLKFSSFAIIVNTLLFPKIMDWKITQNAKLKFFLEKGPLFLFILTIICFMSILLLYPKIFSIFFKDKYQLAYRAFNILILSIPFIFVSNCYIPVLNSFDRVTYIQIVNIISAFVNIMLDFILIKNYGFMAAAFATFLAYFTKNMILSYAIVKMFKVQYKIFYIINVIMFFIVLNYFIYYSIT